MESAAELIAALFFAENFSLLNVFEGKGSYVKLKNLQRGTVE
jgi:hypothetical protein